MKYIVISFSHKNTNIQIREKLAFNDTQLKENFYKDTLSNKNIYEMILLSTCNRIEIICAVNKLYDCNDFIFSIISKYSNIDQNELEGRADIYEDYGAIDHLFSVASSLDSLVIGETQITGQLKEAFRFAMQNNFCSQHLSRAVHFAFKCAADVRKSTEISKSPVSVASTAVSKAKEIVGSLENQTAIVIGAGEMSQLVIKHLLNNNCKIILVNRNIQKAKELASENKEIQVEEFCNLKELINKHSILFTATSSNIPIITNNIVDKLQTKRYWFDIAMPRDIDEQIDCQNVNIFAVDDLKDIVSQNINQREESAKIAYKIVGKYNHEFFNWLQTLDITPIIKELKTQEEIIIKEQVQKAIKNGYIPKEYEENIEKLISTSFTKFMHNPRVKLKEISNTPMSDTVVDVVKLLFNLEKETTLLNKYKCEEE
jgi:glutamyl-tRNA reductase